MDLMSQHTKRRRAVRVMDRERVFRREVLVLNTYSAKGCSKLAVAQFVAAIRSDNPALVTVGI